jgi:dolichyl-phosphate beta-glucosyltransferase
MAKVALITGITTQDGSSLAELPFEDLSKARDEHAAVTVFARQRLDRFGFDVEILLIGRLLGYRIAEVPVAWAYHGGSSVRRVRDAVSMLWDLMRIRVNHWRGAYRPRVDRALADEEPQR